MGTERERERERSLLDWGEETLSRGREFIRNTLGTTLERCLDNREGWSRASPGSAAPRREGGREGGREDSRAQRQDAIVVMILVM